MQELQNELEGLRDISGFMGAIVFTPEGETLGIVTNGSGHFEEIGMIANDILLKSQQAAEIMDVGRGEMVTISAEHATIMAKSSGDDGNNAHIHMVFILAPNGSLGMSKMMMNKALKKIAAML